MKVFVTGADGFLGQNLLKQLIAAGHEVKALIHNPRNSGILDSFEVEKCFGDILDLAAMEKAARGAEVVLHLASLYKFYPWWQKKAPEIYRINVGGTKNILAAARINKVKRFIFTSSVAAIGKNPDGKPSNEDTKFNLWKKSSHYARSKVLAEQEVLNFVKEGFPALILNPAALIGGGDRKPTPTGQMVVDFLNRRYPACFNAVISLADVDDVARGHLQALEKGRIGERYILCNNRAYELKELFSILEQISGVPAPKLKVPYPFLISYLYFDEALSYLFKKQPLFSTRTVEFCRSSIVFDNSKAARELGYTTTPLITTLAKAVNWYKDNGYIKKGARY